MSDHPDGFRSRPAFSSNPLLTENEMAWIEFLRLITADSDPPPTLARIQRLRALFQDRRMQAAHDARPATFQP